MDDRVQVVGWPPIRSFRKNSLQQKKVEQGDGTGMYVKVSMAGAPYLRKIDLKVYTSYPELLKALQNLFKCTFGKNQQQQITFFFPIDLAERKIEVDEIYGILS